MSRSPIQDRLMERMRDLAQRHGLVNEKVEVKTGVLTPEQAIGRPGRRDFPLLRGKEKMVEATIKGAKGQAFTNHPSLFEGTLADVLNFKLDDDRERAVFLASLNSLCRLLGLAVNTRHCRDHGPADCAGRVAAYLVERFGHPRLGLVGLQPALAAALAPHFPLRILDLDPENIGAVREGIIVEDGQTLFEDVAGWAQVLMVTGSTVVNDTIGFWLKLDKPVVFYGNTIAGPAAVLGLHRYCPCSL